MIENELFDAVLENAASLTWTSEPDGYYTEMVTAVGTLAVAALGGDDGAPVLSVGLVRDPIDERARAVYEAARRSCRLPYRFVVLPSEQDQGDEPGAGRFTVHDSATGDRSVLFDRNTPVVALSRSGSAMRFQLRLGGRWVDSTMREVVHQGLPDGVVLVPTDLRTQGDSTQLERVTEQAGVSESLALSPTTSPLPQEPGVYRVTCDGRTAIFVLRREASYEMRWIDIDGEGDVYSPEGLRNTLGDECTFEPVLDVRDVDLRRSLSRYTTFYATDISRELFDALAPWEQWHTGEWVSYHGDHEHMLALLRDGSRSSWWQLRPAPSFPDVEVVGSEAGVDQEIESPATSIGHGPTYVTEPARRLVRQRAQLDDAGHNYTVEVHNCADCYLSVDDSIRLFCHHPERERYASEHGLDGYVVGYMYTSGNLTNLDLVSDHELAEQDVIEECPLREGLEVTVRLAATRDD